MAGVPGLSSCSRSYAERRGGGKGGASTPEGNPFADRRIFANSMAKNSAAEHSPAPVMGEFAL
jgi:hypothetical protein